MSSYAFEPLLRADLRAPHGSELNGRLPAAAMRLQMAF